MNVNDVIVSTIRTVVPALAGILIAWAANFGIELESGALTAVLTSVIVGLYYVAVRALGSRFGAAEWLLGSSKTPTYSTNIAPDPGASWKPGSTS